MVDLMFNYHCDGERVVETTWFRNDTVMKLHDFLMTVTSQHGLKERPGRT